MKSTKLYVVLLFFLATLVPTELLHYVHVVGDLKEHYEHHQNLSFIDFLSHALNDYDVDKSHPEHSHSPFHKHHSVCASTFISLLPEQGEIVVENVLFSISQDEKGIKNRTSLLKEVYLSIWQPPKLS